MNGRIVLLASCLLAIVSCWGADPKTAPDDEGHFVYGHLARGLVFSLAVAAAFVVLYLLRDRERRVIG